MLFFRRTDFYFGGTGIYFRRKFAFRRTIPMPANAIKAMFETLLGTAAERRTDGQTEGHVTGLGHLPMVVPCYRVKYVCMY